MEFLQERAYQPSGLALNKQKQECEGRVEDDKKTEAPTENPKQTQEVKPKWNYKLIALVVVISLICLTIAIVVPVLYLRPKTTIVTKRYVLIDGSGLEYSTVNFKKNHLWEQNINHNFLQIKSSSKGRSLEQNTQQPGPCLFSSEGDITAAVCQNQISYIVNVNEGQADGRLLQDNSATNESNSFDQLTNEDIVRDYAYEIGQQNQMETAIETSDEHLIQINDNGEISHLESQENQNLRLLQTKPKSRLSQIVKRIKGVRDLTKLRERRRYMEEIVHHRNKRLRNKENTINITTNDTNSTNNTYATSTPNSTGIPNATAATTATTDTTANSNLNIALTNKYRRLQAVIENPSNNSNKGSDPTLDFKNPSNKNDSVLQRKKNKGSNIKISDVNNTQGSNKKSNRTRNSTNLNNSSNTTIFKRRNITISRSDLTKMCKSGDLGKIIANNCRPLPQLAAAQAFKKYRRQGGIILSCPANIKTICNTPAPRPRPIKRQNSIFRIRTF